MDDLISLIESVVDRRVSDSNIVKSIPAKVVDVYDNGKAKVFVVSNNAEYVVSNYSGSKVHIGENVDLYYKKNILSNENCYIATSSVKNDSSLPIVTLTCENNIGELFETERILSKVGFSTSEKVWCFIVFNAVVIGSDSSVADFSIEVDKTKLSFYPKQSLTIGETKTISFTLPYQAEIGDHIIEIKGVGAGNVSTINSFVYGQGIREYNPYDPTSDSDYIYNTTENQTDIIYYIGNSLTPEIPKIINGQPVRILYGTSFDNSYVKRVYIPDGVTEIE